MTHLSSHTPYLTLIDTGEVLGGRAVITTQAVSIRCGCRDDLAYDYGHETERT